MIPARHRIVEPFWSRLWNAVRPPPPVPGQHKLLNHRQRRLIWGTLAAVILITTGLGIYQYETSAQDRAARVFEQGMQLLGPGRYQEAVAKFTRAISIRPQYAQAYLQRGNVRQILNQPDAALSDFEMALRIDAHLVQAYTNRGIIYLERGDLRNAVTEFDQSIQMRPTVDAYYQRGQIRYRLGRIQQAIDDYDQSIVLEQNAPYVYLARASAKSSLGDAQGAAQDRATAADLQKLH